jgi:hypothetical protein
MNGINGGELGLQRLQALCLDGFGVHATGIEISDFLFRGAGRRGCVCGGSFKNFAQSFLIFVRKSNETAPDGILRGDGIVPKPAAVGKLIEIVARFAGLIEVVQVIAM